MKKLLGLGLTVLLMTSCGKVSNADLEKALAENPEILAKVIEKNPVVIMTAIQNAAKQAQGEMAKQKQVDEEKQLEAYYKNPLKPSMRSDESIRGNKDGSITVVEYSDFECPFCSRGYSTVKELFKKYPNQVKFVFKHLPLPFHQHAMISAQYYEAVRLQSEEKAFKFHDEIFENQAKLKEGKKFLDSIVVKVGANLNKVQKDIESELVKKRIQEDMNEASSFNIQGTPGFVINGVPLKGAYPIEYMDGIISKTK